MYVDNIIPKNQNVMFHADSQSDIPSAAVAATKLYLILYESFPTDDNDDSSIVKDWEYVRGREAAYTSIKSRLEDDILSIHLLKSLVIVASYKRTIEEPITVYEFMRKMANEHKVPENVLINIDDYIDTDDYPELYGEVTNSTPMCGEGNTNVPYTEQESVCGGEV